MFFVIRLEAFQDCLKNISGGHAFRHVQTEVAEDSGVFLLNIFFTPSVRVEQPPACIVVARVFFRRSRRKCAGGNELLRRKNNTQCVLGKPLGSVFPMIRYLLGFFLTKGKTPSALVTSGSNFSVCSSFFKASRNWNVSRIFSCFLSLSVRIASPRRVGVTVWLEFLFQFLYRVPKVSCVVGCYHFFRFRIGNHEHKRAWRLVCICICTVVCSYPHLR